MTSHADPRFEEAVRSAANTELNDCLLRNPASADAKVVVRVRISTTKALSPSAEAEIKTSLDEVRSSHRNAVIQVSFVVDGTLARKCEVRCDPLPRAHQDDLTQPPPVVDDEDESELLVLTFGTLRFEYLLTSRPIWLPLMRSRGWHDGTSGVILPRSMTVVPNGHLVDIRYVAGGLRLRRTANRPEVAVSVNGVRLTHEVAGVQVASLGEIVYDLPTSAAPGGLKYELADWSVGRLGPAGKPDLLDGDPFEARLTVHDWTTTVKIAPPPRDSRAEPRQFPIPTSSTEQPVRHLHAQVLYSRTVDDRWHVKIYRCATPQHAARLRRYLRTQAVLIEQVNASIGGTGQTPPWAVAPVHVLAAGAGHTGSPLTTNLLLTVDEVVEDPENRLPAWFGVTDQPQPDCFVIVVSPLLNRVGWPNSTLRVVSPGVDQLSELARLAAGLDNLHDQEVAHCDIKPGNVCRYLREDGSSGYVLIDGDSVTRTTGTLADLRPTLAYASAEVTARFRGVRAPAQGEPEINLREHDRFGFVLVALTGIIGADRMDSLLTANEDGKRGVDTPEVVERALRAYWSSRWSAFVTELAAPFQFDALAGDEWKAADWLDRLTKVSKPGPEQADDDRDGPPEPPPPGIHARHVTAIRAEVRAKLHTRPRLREAVAERVKHHQVRVARKAWLLAVLKVGVLPVAVSVVVLIGAVWGR